jgi:hypothetical protein
MTILFSSILVRGRWGIWRGCTTIWTLMSCCPSWSSQQIRADLGPANLVPPCSMHGTASSAETSSENSDGTTVGGGRGCELDD